MLQLTDIHTLKYAFRLLNPDKSIVISCPNAALKVFKLAICLLSYWTGISV